MFSPINKKILVIVAHQDDETLFAGGFLTNIYKSCQLTLVCMSQAKYRTQILRRNTEFKRVCELLDAEPILTNFKDSNLVGSNLLEFFKTRANQVKEMRVFLKETVERIRPNIILTHNKVGEYGHCYHKVIHRLCSEFSNVYNFGVNLKAPKATVKYNKIKKRELFGCYPKFNSSSFCKRFLGFDISFAPETYFNAKPSPLFV